MEHRRLTDEVVRFDDHRLVDTERKINVPLLRKHLEYITAHPEQWDQGTWGRASSFENACGTKACLAGNVVLHGYPKENLEWSSYSLVGIQDPDSEQKYPHNLISVATAARIKLGLTEDQAEFLFSGSNTLYQLWNLASFYTNGEIEIPEGVAELSQQLEVEKYG